MEPHLTIPIESVLGIPWWWQWPTILTLDAPAVAMAWPGNPYWLAKQM